MPAAVVLDNGTGYVKCGFAGDQTPRLVFPSVVGTPVLRYEERLWSGNDDDSNSNSKQPKAVNAAASGIDDGAFVVGEKCTKERSRLELNYPVRNGVVNDWESMGRVWTHAFRELGLANGADCEERNVLLTEAPLNPKRNRERMVAEMFEKYGFRGCFVHVQAVLTLYAQGLLTGLVLDSGDGVSHAVPVIDGFTNQNLTKRLDIAGRKVTKRLVELLGRRGYAVNRTSDVESIRAMKEKLCYVAEDCERSSRLARETTVVLETYDLPDGRTIKVESERFMAPEIMFSPNIIDVESPGVSEMCFNCIQENDLDSRMTMYENIVLSGGSTMFPGFGERLKRDITHLYIERVLNGDETNLGNFMSRLNVETPADRRHSVFVGGSVLADIMKDNKDFWVTKEEFFELGVEKALRKCEGGTFHD